MGDKVLTDDEAVRRYWEWEREFNHAVQEIAFWKERAIELCRLIRLYQEIGRDCWEKTDAFLQRYLLDQDAKALDKITMNGEHKHER